MHQYGIGRLQGGPYSAGYKVLAMEVPECVFKVNRLIRWCCCTPNICSSAMIRCEMVRLGDFIQPKNCEISNSGGGIYSVKY